MRYIGVLHDVKATEKSIAAGGRDSVKDEETGETVTPEYNMLATFQVPLLHSVTKVTSPSKHRVTVYGWVHRRESTFENFKRTPLYSMMQSPWFYLVLGVPAALMAYLNANHKEKSKTS